MPKKEPKKKASGKATELTAGQFIRIAIDKIRPSSMNRQLDPNSQEILSLGESMRIDGLIQPIVVRPTNNHYEIVCGERRWLAAKKIGWTEIPAIVREIGVTEAHVQRLVENLQRQDVPPLEQADGIAVLLERYADAAEVGKRLGQTEEWVRVRARLRNLSESWRKELADPDTAYDRLQMYVGWQEHLAKLPADTQELLWRDRSLVSARTEEDLRRTIGERLRRIGDAPWPAEAEKSAPRGQRCACCEKRSDREPSLFRGIISEEEPGAVCLDPQCWDRKVSLWLRGLLRKARQAHPDLVVLHDQYWLDDSIRNEIPEGVRLVTKAGWYPVGAECEKENNGVEYQKVHGIFLTGRRIGDVIEAWVTPGADDEPEFDPDDEANDSDADREARELADERIAAKKRDICKAMAEGWPTKKIRPAAEMAMMFLANTGMPMIDGIKQFMEMSADQREESFWTVIREEIDLALANPTEEEADAIASVLGLQTE